MTQQAPAGLGLRRGADEIAEFLYGDPAQRRRVYHLCETNQIPFFRLGSMICARETTLLAWIEAQERASVGSEDA